MKKSMLCMRRPLSPPLMKKKTFKRRRWSLKNFFAKIYFCFIFRVCSIVH
jgi:hypothetical protein